MQKPHAAFDAISKAIGGVAISHVWKGYGSALFIECGPLTLSDLVRSDGSVGNPLGQWSIGLDCDWRVEESSRILCGSHGETTSWQSILESLVGDFVEGVETFGDPAELRVMLKSGRRLLTFALDVDGPQWTLTDNAARPPVWVNWQNGGLHTDDGRTPQ